MLRVERQAVLASREVPADFATRKDPVELPTNNDGVALALYDPHGNLVTGTGPKVADAATLGALANRVTDIQSDGARVVAVPVSANEGTVGVIRAEQSTSASDARSQRIVVVIAALAIGVLAIGAAIGYVVAGRLARPVRRLRDAAVQLGNGDFTLDVPRSNVPELDQAALAMTATAQRLDELVARERSFSADASHQLRTPLAGLRAALETELEFPRPDHTEVLRESLDDIDRLESTVNELLAIARTPPIDGAAISLAQLLDQVETTWHGRLAALGRPLTMADAHDLPAVTGNPLMLRHALDVLLDNALTHGAGEVRIDHHVTSDTVTITVADDGQGFPSAAAPQQGLDEADTNATSPHGLGIPLAQRLVEALPGRLVYRRTTTHPQVDIVLQRANAHGGQ